MTEAVLKSHAYCRLAQRMGLSARQAECIANEARHRGVTYGMCSDKKIASYLRHKSEKSHKIVVYYNGFIFIYSRGTKQLITAYEYPENKIENKED